MRVVGGTAKGRQLAAVPGDKTRPILDRVKTALFDILRPELPGAEVLDLFAGTGGVGIEALSQGAAFCVFVDSERPAIETVRKNLELTRLTHNAQVRHTDAFLYLRKSDRAFNIVYVAPPQYKSLWVQALHGIAERPDIVKDGGLVIAQIDPAEYEELSLSQFIEYDKRKYGQTLLVFYRKAAG